MTPVQGRRKPDSRALVARPTAPGLMGVLAGGLTVIVYLVGSGRAFGLDAAVTVHRFVATGSLLDPFRRQLVYNNHVLFSFADHVVYSVTRSTDEHVLRLFPVLCCGLAIGVATTATARQLGALPAITLAALLASNPILVSSGRDARGYSLLLLACVCSTLLLLRLRAGERGRGTQAMYALAIAAGVATHLYALAMLPMHAAVLGRDRDGLRRCLPLAIAGAGVGLVAYAGIASTMLHAHRGRQFQPDFPSMLIRALLGGTWLTTATLLVPLGAGVLVLRRRPGAPSAAAAAVMIVAATWLGAPQDLYPRFFIWLVPAVAFVVAAGVARHPSLAVLVAIAFVVQVVRAEPDFARSEIANREAGQLAARVTAAGGRACAFSLSAFAMEPYGPGVLSVSVTRRPPPCDVVFQLTAGGPASAIELPPSWRSAFPFRRSLDAVSPGVAFGREPLPGER